MNKGQSGYKQLGTDKQQLSEEARKEQEFINAHAQNLNELFNSEEFKWLLDITEKAADSYKTQLLFAQNESQMNKYQGMYAGLTYLKAKVDATQKYIDKTLNKDEEE